MNNSHVPLFKINAPKGYNRKKQLSVIIIQNVGMDTSTQVYH